MLRLNLSGDFFNLVVEIPCFPVVIIGNDLSPDLVHDFGCQLVPINATRFRNGYGPETTGACGVS